MAETYKTLAEWRVANREWNDAGRPGGRLARPVLDSITTCDKCGGAKMEPELMPAFPHTGNFCGCGSPMRLRLSYWRRTDVSQRSTIYLTCGSDYEWHAVLGAFTTREAAEAHAAYLRKQSSGGELFSVEAHETDPPKEQRLGAWLVRVGADGASLNAEDFLTSCTPSDECKPLTGAWAGGYQAYGRSKPEAYARARAALAVAAHPGDRTPEDRS